MKKINLVENKKLEAQGFLKKLGLLDSAFLVIGAVIGSGIFMTTGFMANSLGSPALIIVAWIVGGLITLCGALTFAELGAMFPKAGGQFVYLHEAYGDIASFLFGWGFFWGIECGGIAALAVAFANHLRPFFPILAKKMVILDINILSSSYSLSYGQIVAVLAILFLSGVNYLGIRSGICVQNFFTVLRLGALAALVFGGLIFGEKAGVGNFGQFFQGSGGFSLKLFGLSLIAVLWTYDGWYSVSCTAEEVKNPEKNIPLGLIIGTLSVILIYLLANLLYLMALSLDKMKGVERVAELVSIQLFGPRAALVLSALIALAIFGCLSATIIYGPRVYFAMAEKGLFFRSMGFLHPRYRVPTKAIAGQALWSCLLCLSGTFQALYEYVIFVLVIFFAATGASVIALRRSKPEQPRPYKVWGYPIIPIIFIIANLVIFLNTVLLAPVKSGVGLVIILSGIPAFLYWKNSRKERHSSKS